MNTDLNCQNSFIMLITEDSRAGWEEEKGGQY